jgi:hypothetical protein
MLDPLPNWIQFTLGLEVAKKNRESNKMSAIETKSATVCASFKIG